jgi:hypothetical protein
VTGTGCFSETDRPAPFVAPCDANDVKQTWGFDPTTLISNDHSSLCLTAVATNRIMLTPCNAGDARQLWLSHPQR